MKESTPFSKADLKLLNDSKIIERKNRVLKQIELQFKKLGNNTLINHQSLNAFSSTPKVSKGENFEGYPFRVLDYPRVFTTNDVFAFRTLIWWGNIISFTLHLKGKYLITHFSKLKQLLSTSELPLYYSNSGNEWSQNPNDKNFKLLGTETLAQLNPKEIDFLKIVQVKPLDKINQLNELYQLFLNQLIVPLFYDSI
ncbi:MAG: hypothetical protein RJQ00_04055 [Vicingaceae bacterium]